jgi:hypothetical protein
LEHNFSSVPLICCFAGRGSGKSVLQAFNAKWFCEESNGIAIEINFGGDQENLLHGHNVTHYYDFMQRILHRLLQTRRAEIDVSHHMKPDSPLLKTLLAAPDPFHAILELLPKLVGAPSDVKVLLTIDDLLTGVCEGARNPICFALGTLFNQMGRMNGSDSSLPKLFVTVPLTGTYDLDMDGSLQLQPLQPIMLHRLEVNLLPEMFRPFYNNSGGHQVPILLPSKMHQTQACSKLASLLTATGGHPGRLNCCLGKLQDFDVVRRDLLGHHQPTPDDSDAPSLLLGQIDIWLHEQIDGCERWEHIIRDMDSCFQFPLDGFQGLVEANNTSSSLVAVIEMLAKDCACPFWMPKNRERIK